MRISRHRRIGAALTLLVVMVANFAFEGTLLYRVYAMPVLATAEPQSCSGGACSGAAVEEEAGDSCCSDKKKVPACGCPCCGDSCPMGDACTCMADGKSTTKSDGLFFRLPGCHPAQPDSHGAYLPFSMRLVFLPVDTNVRPPAVQVLESLDEVVVCVAGTMPAPPVPPPECSAA